ncbi:MAG: peptide/nickel transport system substrate-binding protein [Thermomicrobiales bacterium]|nr:peptide/nickel transport system substrate-binding protein [Thermomicrobiales bacterium]
MIRLFPQPGEPIDAEELNDVNGLVQARIDGRISRRALVQRALALGIGAPVVGVMLHATSDLVKGAPSDSRRATLTHAQDVEPVPVSGPTQPEGEMQEGGTIVVGTSEEPDTLHPYLTYLATTFDVYSGVCESLLEYDSTQTLQPALATEFAISPDGLTYTFKLRPGVTFHNGDPLVAQNVIDCWKIIMNTDFGAWQQIGWNKITDITAPDELTVVMTTEEVYAPFLTYVGAGQPILPSSEIAKGLDAFKQEFGRQRLIGTGPVTFVEWKAKEQIVLARNETYWGSKPHLDRVIYRIVPDTNTLLVQLQTGEVQLCGSAGALGALDADKAVAYDNVIVLEHDTQSWQHLDLKHIDFLRMTKVRQALDFATPSRQIIEQLLGNRVLPSVADIAPINWAFNPNIQPRPYDPEMTKQLLTEAGLTQGDDGIWEGPTPAPDTPDPNGPATGPVKKLEIELWAVAGSSQTERIVQIIAQSWNEIGIKTEVHFEDVSTIFGPEGYTYTDKMTAGLYTWTNGNDPDDLPYWHSTQRPTCPTCSGFNTPAYFFPFNFQAEIDDLTYRAATTVDQEERKQLYWQIQELLHEELPVIFIYWSRDYPVVAKNIGGFWPSAFTNLLWNVEQWYLTQ